MDSYPLSRMVQKMNNIIESKSFRFSVRIVRLVKYIRKTQKEYTLTDQLLRAGTSIGANIVEAEQGHSRADFIAKLNIALKEAVETRYWLRLLHATEYLSDREFDSVYADCEELIKLLISIVRTSKS